MEMKEKIQSPLDLREDINHESAVIPVVRSIAESIAHQSINTALLNHVPRKSVVCEREVGNEPLLAALDNSESSAPLLIELNDHASITNEIAERKRPGSSINLNEAVELNELLLDTEKDVEDLENVLDSPISADKYDHIISSFQTHSRKSFSFLQEKGLSTSAIDLSKMVDQDHSASNLSFPNGDDSHIKLDNHSGNEKQQGDLQEMETPFQKPISDLPDLGKVSPSKSPQTHRKSSIMFGRRRSTHPNILFPKNTINFSFQFLSNIEEYQRKNTLQYLLLSLQESFFNMATLQQQHAIYYDVSEIAAASTNRSKLHSKSFAQSAIPLHELHSHYHDLQQYYTKVCMKASVSGQNMFSQVNGSKANNSATRTTIHHFISDAYLTSFQKLKLLNILKKLEKNLTHYLMKVTEKVQSLYDKNEERILSFHIIEEQCQNYYQYDPSMIRQVNLMDYLDFFHAPEKSVNKKATIILQSLLRNAKGLPKEGSKNVAGFESRPESAVPSPSLLGSISRRNLRIFSNTQAIENAGNAAGTTDASAINESERGNTPNMASAELDLNKSYRYHAYKKKDHCREFKFGFWNYKLEKSYEKMISLQTHYYESIKIRKSSNKMLKRHIRKQLKKMDALSKELEDIGYNHLDFKEEREIDEKFRQDGSDESAKEDELLSEVRIDEMKELGVIQDHKMSKATNTMPNESEKEKSKGRKSAEAGLEAFSDVSLDEFDETEYPYASYNMPLSNSLQRAQNQKRVDFQPGRIRPRSGKGAMTYSRSQPKIQDTNESRVGSNRPRSAVAYSKPTKQQNRFVNERVKDRPGSPYLAEPFKIPAIDVDVNIFIDEKAAKKTAGHTVLERPSSPYLSAKHKTLLEENKKRTQLANKIRIMNTQAHEKQFHIYRGVSLRYSNIAGSYNSKLAADVTKHQQQYLAQSAALPSASQSQVDLNSTQFRSRTLSTSADQYEETELGGSNIINNTNLNSSFKPVRMSVREIRTAMKRGYALSGLFNNKQSTPAESSSKSVIEVDNENFDLEAGKRKHSVKPLPNSLYEIQTLPLKEKKKSLYNLEKLNIELDNVFAVDKEIDKLNEKNKESEQILESLFYNPAKPTKYAMTKTMINVYGFSPKKAMEIFAAPLPRSVVEEEKKKSAKKFGKKGPSMNSSDELHELLFGKKPVKRSPAQSHNHRSSSSKSSLLTPKLKGFQVGTFEYPSSFKEDKEVQSPKQVKWRTTEIINNNVGVSAVKEVDYDPTIQLLDLSALDSSHEGSKQNENKEEELHNKQKHEEIQDLNIDEDEQYREEDFEHENNENIPMTENEETEQTKSEEDHQNEIHESGFSPAEHSQQQEFNECFIKEQSNQLQKKIFSFFKLKGFIFDDENDEHEGEARNRGQDRLKELDEKIEQNPRLASLADEYQQKLSNFSKILSKQKQQLVEQLAPNQLNSISSLRRSSTISSLKESLRQDTENNLYLLERELRDMSDLVFQLLPELCSLMEEHVVRPYLQTLFSKSFLQQEVQIDLILFFVKKCLHFTKLADSGILTIPLDRTTLLYPITKTAMVDDEKPLQISSQQSNNVRKRPNTAPITSSRQSLLINQKKDGVTGPVAATRDDNELGLNILIPNDYHDNFIRNNTFTSNAIVKSGLSPHNPQKHFAITKNWDENSDKIRELLYYDESAQALELYQLNDDGVDEDLLVPHDYRHNFLYQLHASRLTHHNKPFLTGTNAYSAYHPIGFHHQHAASIYHSQTHYDYNSTYYYQHLIQRKDKFIQEAKYKNERLFRSAPSSPTISRGDDGKDEKDKSAPILHSVLLQEKPTHNKTLDKYLESPTPFLEDSSVFHRHHHPRQAKKQEEKNLLLNKHPQFLDNKINNFLYLIHNLQKQIYQMLFNHLELQLIQPFLIIIYYLFHEFYFLIYQQYSSLIHHNIQQGKRQVYPKSIEEIMTTTLSYSLILSKQLFDKQVQQFLQQFSQYFPSISSKMQEFLLEKYHLQNEIFEQSIEELEKIIRDNVEQAKEYMELIQKTK